ncbi:hypothetical protein AM499_19545 [Bacillus sp. FJAT-22090]|nr:hypothetical protein AM499_19545 [Bacillus sp. FJAT-22090]
MQTNKTPVKREKNSAYRCFFELHRVNPNRNFEVKKSRLFLQIQSIKSINFSLFQDKLLEKMFAFCIFGAIHKW